jgi:serine/threonine-protein kinase
MNPPEPTDTNTLLPPPPPPTAEAPAGVDLLLQEQRERWGRGERPAVEVLLARYTGVSADADTVLDLLFNEVLLREAAGESVAPEELQRRFPDLAEAIRDHWQVHCALAADDPPPWPTVPGYAIEAVLGRGGMGVVYRARDLALKRTVALKMILSGAEAGPEELLRFRREAEAAARLRHPHIVQIHEIGEHQGRPYLVLEYVAGGSLAAALAGKPLPPRQAAELTETLARAVAEAHRQQVVHRDLKPANILLVEGGGWRVEGGIPVAGVGWRVGGVVG